MGLDAIFEDQPFKVEPEAGLGEGKVADLAALGEDGQALAMVVEVLELHLLQRTLPQAVVEQQPERDPPSAPSLPDRPALDSSPIRPIRADLTEVMANG